MNVERRNQAIAVSDIANTLSYRTHFPIIIHFRKRMYKIYITRGVLSEGNRREKKREGRSGEWAAEGEGGADSPTRVPTPARSCARHRVDAR